MSNKKLKRCYFIHDNGSRPFKVCDYDNNSISIFINQLEPGKDVDNPVYEKEINTFTNDSETDIFKFWKSFSYNKIWIPKYTDQYIKNKNFALGNSILIETTKNKYIYVGFKILEFSIKVPIVDFQSPITGTDVPYPYAKTDDSYIIFLPLGKGKVQIEIEEMDMIDSDKKNSNPYGRYYALKPSTTNNSKFKGKNLKSVKVLYSTLPDVTLKRRKATGSAKAQRTNRSTKAQRTNRSTKAKRTSRSTKAKRTSRSTKAKRTNRSTKTKRTSRSTKAKRTNRSRSSRK